MKIFFFVFYKEFLYSKIVLTKLTNKSCIKSTAIVYAVFNMVKVYKNSPVALSIDMFHFSRPFKQVVI